MILVDTTVLIDIVKGVQNDKTNLFREVLKNNLVYGISEYTYLEMLQGVKSDNEYSQLSEYLLDMNIYFLPKSLATYEKASSIYRDLRRHGITPRSTIDILIALTAIVYDLSLLHNDRDFDEMSAKVPELIIYQ
jgi:predicted nucleic acid-binding protein